MMEVTMVVKTDAVMDKMVKTVEVTDRMAARDEATRTDNLTTNVTITVRTELAKMVGKEAKEDPRGLRDSVATAAVPDTAVATVVGVDIVAVVTTEANANSIVAAATTSPACVATINVRVAALITGELPGTSLRT